MNKQVVTDVATALTILCSTSGANVRQQPPAIAQFLRNGSSLKNNQTNERQQQNGNLCAFWVPLLIPNLDNVLLREKMDRLLKRWSTPFHFRRDPSQPFPLTHPPTAHTHVASSSLPLRAQVAGCQYGRSISTQSLLRLGGQNPDTCRERTASIRSVRGGQRAPTPPLLPPRRQCLPRHLRSRPCRPKQRQRRWRWQQDRTSPRLSCPWRLLEAIASGETEEGSGRVPRMRAGR